MFLEQCAMIFLGCNTLGRDDISRCIW